MKLLLIALALIFIPIDIVGAAPADFITCEGTTCSACDIVDILNKAIIWLFGAVFLLFTYLMVIAGFGLITSNGNTSALEAAKSKFTNAIIGLIIMMSAWLIVDTLMRTIVGGGSGEGVSNAPIGELEGWGPWSTVKCQKQTPTVTPEVGDGGGVVVGDSNGEIRNTLFSSGVSVNKEECPDGVNYITHPGGCTSVEGLNAKTVQDIISLRQQCNTACPNFTITGGSELGHSGGTAPGTHGGGDKFDLRWNDVNNFINNDEYFTDGLQGSRGARVNKVTGTSCVAEGDHWDCRRGGF